MVMNKRILWVLLIVASGCNTVVNEKDFLTEVSKNLDRIKSASYFVTTMSAAIDTFNLRGPYESFFKFLLTHQILWLEQVLQPIRQMIPLK